MMMKKINTFFYTMWQGFRNIFRNKWFSLASVATIAACLFLLGLFFAMVANVQHIVRTVQEDICVTVFFVEGTTAERMEEIHATIDNREEVLRTEFRGADEEWQWYSETMLHGNTDGFLENPLDGMENIRVYMKDVAQQEDLVVYIQSIPEVDHVNRSLNLANTLTGVNRLISYVFVGIIVILLIVSIFLISNTVTIGISVRKEEINIMKYIGATDFFVRAPFVLEGMMIGLVGAALPLFAIYYGYNKLLTYVMDKFTVLSGLLNFLSVEEIFKFLTPVSLLVGVGIGFFGSMSTVKKHLNV